MIDKRTNDPSAKDDGEDFSGEDRADATLPPEAHNESQDDEPSQAQSLADEALGRRQGYDDSDLEETERVPGGHSPELGDEESGSAPDLVDTMKEMVRGGRIDMGAFRGERNDDDEEDGLGAGGLEDDWPRGAE